MNRVQREKAGWKFTKGEWRRPFNWRMLTTAPPDDESRQVPVDMEPGPEPPPAEPADAPPDDESWREPGDTEPGPEPPPAEDETAREAGDMERGPEPPSAEPAAED